MTVKLLQSVFTEKTLLLQKKNEELKELKRRLESPYLDDPFIINLAKEQQELCRAVNVKVRQLQCWKKKLLECQTLENIANHMTCANK
jgi:siroheme synthase (precorrin-2 oxidase/ferrochelatase)